MGHIINGVNRKPRGWYDTRFSDLDDFPRGGVVICQARVRRKRCRRRAKKIGQCTLDRCVMMGSACKDQKCIRFMRKEIWRRAWEFNTAIFTKERREERGWSIQELAKQAGVRPKDVRDIEKMKRGYSAKSLKRVIETIGMIYIPFFTRRSAAR